MTNSTQSSQKIELHGIERVLPNNRADHNLWNNFTLWLSANFVIPTLALGTLAQAVFKLGTRESLIIIFRIQNSPPRSSKPKTSNAAVLIDLLAIILVTEIMTN